MLIAATEGASSGGLGVALVTGIAGVIVAVCTLAGVIIKAKRAKASEDDDPARDDHAATIALASAYAKEHDERVAAEQRAALAEQRLGDTQEALDACEARERSLRRRRKP